MFVEPKDLLDELTGHGGETFELFMRSLVGAEADTHGISASDIDWDHVVTAKDAGRDLVIRKRHQDENPRFIPNSPSIWSFKSGADGIEPATLNSELTHKAHQRIRQHLMDGNVYVYCALQRASQEKRVEMYAKRDELAVELQFDPDNVEFRWLDALAPTLEAHPNLIVRHLPRLASRLKDVVTLDQWMRESPDCLGFDVPWVNFCERNSFKRRVQEHLLSRDGPAVLHVAGLSGIGKTRTAIQACLDDDALTDIWYVRQRGTVTDDFLRFIESEGHHIRLIIDEVKLTEFQTLFDRFQHCGDRVRLLTIGPARRGERGRSSVLIMPEPTEAEDVLRVVQEAAPNLTKEVRLSIAEHSAHVYWFSVNWTIRPSC